MPGKYNTKIYLGDTWQRTIVILDPNGAAVDLTGYTVVWTVRAAPTDTAAVLTLSTATGEITISTAVLTVTIESAVTAGLTPNAYYCHDLQLTSPTGVVTTYLAGVVTVIQDVTR